MIGLNIPVPFFKSRVDHSLTPTQAATQLQENNLVAQKAAQASIQNILAPDKIEIDFDYIKLNNQYIRTIFVSGYPRFVSPGWLDPIINFDHSLDLSFFIYPVEGKTVLDELRRKIAEMEAEIATDLQRGKVVDPGTQAKLEDARDLQEQLVKGAERFFQFSFYITIHADTLAELQQISQQVESTLGSLLIVAKHTTLQMEDGLYSTIPLGVDKLSITRNMDTTSLATTFPFVSAELSSDRGVMYGINEDNDSLVIFDRFKLENYNSVIFATSGAGKSFAVKLESVRSLMLGAEVFIIDPEAEYEALAKAVGGEFISFSFSTPAKINPFDLSGIVERDENQLGLKILSLHSLFAVIMGQLTPTEQALLDRAFIATYKAKGITPDPETQTKTPPLMEDLYKALQGMEDPIARGLADRIEKFITGSFRGIFDQHTNIDLDNPFTVFSVRDLEEALRPIAMFIILDFIWTRVKRDLKKRILVVDEAWHMMRYGDTAQFLYSVAKRARKYYLGLTTITQDVEDFLAQDIGKAIVTNSSLKLLMKQSPAAIERVGEVFKLSEGEKQLLLAADVGEGIFFAGPNHVALRIVASEMEHELITSKPEEVLAIRQTRVTTPVPAINSTPAEPQMPTSLPPTPIIVEEEKPVINQVNPSPQVQTPTQPTLVPVVDKNIPLHAEEPILKPVEALPAQNIQPTIPVQNPQAAPAAPQNPQNTAKFVVEELE
jgi:conjugal transfer ATP-binding protein TraC